MHEKSLNAHENIESITTPKFNEICMKIVYLRTKTFYSASNFLSKTLKTKMHDFFHLSNFDKYYLKIKCLIKVRYY